MLQCKRVVVALNEMFFKVQSIFVLSSKLLLCLSFFLDKFLKKVSVLANMWFLYYVDSYTNYKYLLSSTRKYLHL